MEWTNQVNKRDCNRLYKHAIFSIYCTSFISRQFNTFLKYIKPYLQLKIFWTSYIPRRLFLNYVKPKLQFKKNNHKTHKKMIYLFDSIRKQFLPTINCTLLEKDTSNYLKNAAFSRSFIMCNFS